MGQEVSKEETIPKKDESPVREVPRHRRQDSEADIEAATTAIRKSVERNEPEPIEQVEPVEPVTPPSTKVVKFEVAEEAPGAPTPTHPSDEEAGVAEAGVAEAGVEKVEKTKGCKLGKRFVAVGFCVGMVLGPLALLVLLLPRMRKTRGRVLKTLIGILLAFMVWVVVIVLCVSLLS